ncbi:MAG TPA: DUF2569 domain-containing protein [Gammaproteobacteria bacterium]|jgi:hypothetical protein|nr:DUF2569 domain-containing protein [Gammaproteobacteria bacterium]
MTETSPDTAASAPKKLEGLGGWLILPAIGMFWNMLALSYGLLSAVALKFSPDMAEAMAGRGIDINDPAWLRLLNFELFTSVLLLCLVIALLVLFFLKSWWFPRAFIAFLVASVVVKAGDVMLAHGVATLDLSQTEGSSFTELMRPVLASVIWIPYFLVSERVKNTFVRHRPATAT